MILLIVVRLFPIDDKIFNMYVSPIFLDTLLWNQYGLSCPLPFYRGDPYSVMIIKLYFVLYGVDTFVIYVYDVYDLVALTVYMFCGIL